jgi:hypothetical protein
MRWVLAGIALVAVATGLLLINSTPSEAHHAFGAEFDPDAPIRLEGPVVRLEWVNPHSWIHIEVTNADGTKEVWMVEGGTPNVLQRRGLRRDCLPVGTVLIVDGYQARDHSLRRANARDVTFTDGRTFFVGSLGTGAPYEGAQQTATSGAC